MAVSAITELRPYLTFSLADEVFAIDVAKAREILEFSNIMKIPQTPEFMRGVINLRGGVVPVMDLRMKFGFAETQRTVDTCIIVVEIASGEETLVLGILADSVQEVFEIEPENIEPAPKIGMNLDTSFIMGMGKRGDAFLIILDIDRVFSSEDLAGVDGQEKPAAGGQRPAA